MLLVQNSLVILVTQHLNTEFRTRWIQDTQYDLFAKQCWTGVYTKVDCAVLGQSHFDASILRYTALGDIHSRHYFQAGTDLVCQDYRRLRDLRQNAVKAGSHAEYLLVRFEVNVRCATFNGVQQDLIDEPDYWCILDIVATVFFLFIIFTCNIEIFEIEVIIIKPRHAGVDCFDRLGYPLFELVLLYNNRVNAKAGRELDVVDCLQIGGI